MVITQLGQMLFFGNSQNFVKDRRTMHGHVDKTNPEIKVFCLFLAKRDIKFKQNQIAYD